MRKCPWPNWLQSQRGRMRACISSCGKVYYSLVSGQSNYCESHTHSLKIASVNSGAPLWVKNENGD